MSENRKQLCKLAKVHLGWSPNFPFTGHRLTGPSISSEQRRHDTECGVSCHGYTCLKWVSWLKHTGDHAVS